MKKKPYLSVIIPAYNEEDRLPLTLVDVDRHLSTVEYTYEILVVNDGSSDDTIQVVERFKKLIPNLRLIDQEPNQGKGEAVRRGMLEANGEYRLFMDADNSTSVDQFEKIIPYLKEGYKVVIGSRTLKESRLSPPEGIIKQILGKAGNLFIQLLVLPGIWDTQCGFKCFSEDAAVKVFNLQRIKGWGFDVEILALAKRLGYKIKQIPVVWVNDTASHVGLMAYVNTLIETVKIRVWLWRGVYNLK